MLAFGRGLSKNRENAGKRRSGEREPRQNECPCFSHKKRSVQEFLAGNALFVFNDLCEAPLCTVTQNRALTCTVRARPKRARRQKVRKCFRMRLVRRWACSSAGRALALQGRELVPSLPCPSYISIVSNKPGNLLFVQS